MHTSNKVHIRKRRIGDERQSFRDRIRDKIARITKKQNYFVEESKESEGDKRYVVVYRSETDKGCGEGVVFKGTFKECHKLKKELNDAMKERKESLREQD